MNGELVFTFFYGGFVFLVGLFANWVIKKEFAHHIQSSEENN